MRHLAIVNWSKFQHYSKRNPPWIKLYNSLLDSYEFCRLPDASKWLAVGMLLLASKTDNRIPADSDWIAHRLSMENGADYEPLVKCKWLRYLEDDASKSQADRTQGASKVRVLDRDRDRDRDRVGEARAREDQPDPLTIPPLPPSGRYADDDYQSLIASLFGKTLTDKQLGALRSFLEQRYNGDQLEALGRILAVMRAEKFGLGFLVSQLRKPEELYVFERQRWAAVLAAAMEARGPGARASSILASTAARLGLPVEFVRQLQPLPEEEA